MNIQKHHIIAGVFALVVILSFFAVRTLLVPRPDLAPAQPIATAAYRCDAGKSMTASFYEGTPVAVKEGERPVPTGSVTLVLSDGRSLALKQTLSADGARYANDDESIVFWSKGTGAMFTEDGKDTFANCDSAPAEEHPAVAPVPSSNQDVGAKAGEHCGGNMANAASCAAGLHCAPAPGSHLPFGDVGGVCVQD